MTNNQSLASKIMVYMTVYHLSLYDQYQLKSQNLARKCFGKI